MDEYGISAVARDRPIRACFNALGMICFLAAGEDECRAWPIAKGTSAHNAAGKVRQEPTAYIVADGDIMNIKFNV